MKQALNGTEDMPFGCGLEQQQRIFDPRLPIVQSERLDQTGSHRVGQYRRRANILAIMRRLLIEEGYAGVTIRRVCELSGNAVQTFYNLVGPRDQAVVEAISEFTLELARAATPDLDLPDAIVKTVEWQGTSVRNEPEFCRQVCLLAFHKDRHIFYQFRDRQMKMVTALLMKQKHLGVLRPNVSCRLLAENITLYASAVFTEWVDRPVEMDELYAKLRIGYLQLLNGATIARV